MVMDQIVHIEGLSQNILSFVPIETFVSLRTTCKSLYYLFSWSLFEEVRTLDSLQLFKFGCQGAIDHLLKNRHICILDNGIVKINECGCCLSQGFHWASKFGQIDLFKYLLLTKSQKVENYIIFNAFSQGAKYGRINLLWFIWNIYGRNKPIWFAGCKHAIFACLRNKQLPYLRTLLTIDPTQCNRAFYLACVFQNINAVNMLLEMKIFPINVLRSSKNILEHLMIAENSNQNVDEILLKIYQKIQISNENANKDNKTLMLQFAFLFLVSSIIANFLMKTF